MKMRAEIKRIIALIMVVILFVIGVPFQGVEASALEMDTVVEKKEADSHLVPPTEVEVEADNSQSASPVEASNQENTITSLTDFVDMQLNYMMVEKPYLQEPGIQSILIGVGNQNITIEKASLDYIRKEDGTEYSVSAKEIQSDGLIFEMNYSDLENAAGTYCLKSVTYQVLGISHSLTFSEIGMEEVSYGVNVSVDTQPDAVVEETPEDISVDIINLDENGNVVSEQTIEEAITESGNGIQSYKLEDALNAGRQGKVVVVLDPGHDNTHAGAQQNGYGEEDLNIKIAQYCKEELEQYGGVKVYLTRNISGVCPSPGTPSRTCNANRVAFAQSVGANVYVSLHLNSSGSASPRGAEIYYPNGNYNGSVSSQGKELAQKILDKLVALGIADRGVKIVNSTLGVTYPDESMADDYAVIRLSKLAGIPAIIVEHAFLSNGQDVGNFLNSEEKLKNLGIADAAGIAAYFDLSKEFSYPEGGNTAAVTVNARQDGVVYYMQAAGVPKLQNLFFAVWSNRGSDVKWYSATKDLNGLWNAGMSVSDFGLDGSYGVDAYAVRLDGSYYKVGSGGFQVAGPVSGNIQIKSINSTNGTFDVIVSNIKSLAGVQKIEIPVWSAADLSDLHRYQAILQSDGTYRANVDIKNHKYNYGVYATQAYVTDNSGLKRCVTSMCLKLPRPSINVGAFGTSDESAFILTTENLPYGSAVKGVRFGVWNAGLSDLKWYGAICDASGKWMAFLGISDYKKAGNYYGDAYVDFVDGSSQKIGSLSFNVKAPKVQAISIMNKNEERGTFDVVVKGVTSVSGVSMVEVPVWTTSDLSDLYWYKAIKQGDGSYIAKANISNHKYNYGVYAAHAYVTTQNGVRIGDKSVCDNFMMPQCKVQSFDSGNQTAFILTAEKVPYSSQVTGMKFGVWNSGLDDLQWYGALKDNAGRWLAFVGIDNYRKTGNYYADAYVELADGTSRKVGSTHFYVEGPKATGLTVSKPKETDGIFEVLVTGVNSTSGIRQVRIPIWSAADQSDLVWYQATRVNESSYVVNADIKNHKNNLGTYVAHVYVTDNNNITLNVGQMNCQILNVNNVNYNIMGSSGVSLSQMASYYRANETYPGFYATTDAPTIEAFCQIYLEECNAEGVKAEVAFAQAMNETGFLRYLGDARREQFNFAGIGATGNGVPGNRFGSVREGVRAQIQHLKAYASTESLRNPCVDPRFFYVKRGSAPYLEWLGINENPYGGGWAAAKNYGYTIKNRYMSKLLSY